MVQLCVCMHTLNMGSLALQCARGALGSLSASSRLLFICMVLRPLPALPQPGSSEREFALILEFTGKANSVTSAAGASPAR
jgi:hypothetical protein